MRPRGRGFTLVELLVVIGIIALLMAILFPVIAAVWRSVQETQCKNNMKELARVVMAYANDYDGSFPFCGNPAAGLASGARPSANDWIYVGGPTPVDNLDRGVLFRNKFVGTRDIFYCPTDVIMAREDRGQRDPHLRPHMPATNPSPRTPLTAASPTAISSSPHFHTTARLQGQPAARPQDLRLQCLPTSCSSRKATTRAGPTPPSHRFATTTSPVTP